MTLQELKDKLKNEYGLPDEKIREIIDPVLGGKPDALNFEVKCHIKLEKFDGEYEPGKEPVEVIEREGEL